MIRKRIKFIMIPPRAMANRANAGKTDHLSLLLKQPVFPIPWLSTLVRNGN